MAPVPRVLSMPCCLGLLLCAVSGLNLMAISGEASVTSTKRMTRDSMSFPLLGDAHVEMLSRQHSLRQKGKDSKRLNSEINKGATPTRLNQVPSDAPDASDASAASDASDASDNDDKQSVSRPTSRRPITSGNAEAPPGEKQARGITVEFDEFCVADINFVRRFGIPVELIPFINNADNRFRASLRMSGELFESISEEIPPYCVIKDESPPKLVALADQRTSAKVMVGERENVRKANEEIKFEKKGDVCVAIVKDDVEILKTRVGEQLLGDQRMFEMIVKSETGSTLLLRKEIPDECAIYHRCRGELLPWIRPRPLSGSGVRSTLVKRLEFGTTKPQRHRKEFEQDHIRIVMDQKCWATVDLAHTSWNECEKGIEKMEVKLGRFFFVAKTIFYLLKVWSHCDDSAKVRIPEFLNCALRDGEISFTKTASGLYKAQFGAPKTKS